VSIAHWAATGAFAIRALTPSTAFAASDRLIYSYTDGADGASPAASFIADAAGNLYSTTFAGGTANQGTVFRLAPGGRAPKVLYSFTGGDDGAQPSATPLMDGQGNLYGTTSAGGKAGLGTVFKLAPDGTETVLYSFAGGAGDGAVPMAGLVADRHFNLYGTTQAGGYSNYGTVFEVTRDGREKTLHVFGGSPGDGAYPIASAALDRAGNLYVTTLGGGIQSNYCGIGCGTVVKVVPKAIAPAGESVIHFFQPDSADGTNPGGNLVMDGSGNLLGTTTLAGSSNCIAGGGCGVVFKLSRNGNGYTETVVYAFQGGADGATSYSGLIKGGAGNFYGTTFDGGVNKGASPACNFGNVGCGTVYEITAAGKERVIHRFDGTPKDGANPQGNLYLSHAGVFYGTTVAGGTDPACFENEGCGAIFELKP
jgi:uncharacterized repeat protein (TIGR03803 family)